MGIEKVLVGDITEVKWAFEKSAFFQYHLLFVILKTKTLFDFEKIIKKIKLELIIITCQ